MVEAIEDLFIPLLVYNNKESDAAILKRFDEPSWNNPVVRFLDSSGSDVIPRKENVWTTAEIVRRSIDALEQAKHPVPSYLRLVDKSKSDEIETAEFAMHCYWEGEAKLGSIAGVLNTRSGWRNQLEVVEVTFDSTVVGYVDLLNEAKKFECASQVFTHTAEQLDVAKQQVGDEAVPVENRMRDAKSSDQKYYLRNTTAIHLPLTELQATKINAAIGLKQPWKQLLSPRQLKLLKQIDEAIDSNPTVLAKFSYPTDPLELATYATNLADQLKQLDAGEK